MKSKYVCILHYLYFFKTLTETVGNHFETHYFNSNLQARGQKRLFLCLDIWKSWVFVNSNVRLRVHCSAGSMWRFYFVFKHDQTWVKDIIPFLPPDSFMEKWIYLNEMLLSRSLIVVLQKFRYSSNRNKKDAKWASDHSFCKTWNVCSGFWSRNYSN